MQDPVAEEPSLTSKLRTLRWASMLLGLWNLGLVVIGGFLIMSVSPSCSGSDKLPLGVVSLIACVRIGCMVAAGKAQQSAAATIVGHSVHGGVAAHAFESRFEPQRRYRRWLWWTRFGMLVNTMQFLAALYLMYIIVKNLSREGGDSAVCFLGHEMKDMRGEKFLMASFLALVWLVAMTQCFTGSDVLRWRSFYATHDTAWKAHYSEVFDHGIREAFCCFGRVKYLSVFEEDEVYSVARLLGDLVAYRATGIGHLELLAGLALLQSHKQSPKGKESCYEFTEAHQAHILEATLLHRFSEAAYTGPLLDFGRNPVLFPFSWLYRQGVLTPWNRSRRLVLEGDNWWRGHAAAFLKCSDLPPETLRSGRVSQKNREVAYFIVVLHDIRSVVVAVRGTETPEDLLTDGLCRECDLAEEDLDGLINNNQLHSNVRETVLSSLPHYGHSGIVESARELYMQIDSQPGEGMASETSGFLSSLLGPGCECDGYKVCIVGHSLGGAVATLLGLRLKGRYPTLHVYAYGPLPCVDSVVAEACSDFVTTIVYNDEFSSRLSVNSVLRLRAAAIQALSDDSSADSAVISKFARKILNVRRHHEIGGNNQKSPSLSNESSPDCILDGSQLSLRRSMKYSIQNGEIICNHAVSCAVNSSTYQYSSLAMNGIASESIVSDEKSCIVASQSKQAKQQERMVMQKQSIEASPFDDPDSGILNVCVYDYGSFDLPAEVSDDNFNPTCLFGIQSSPSVDDPSIPTEVAGELKELLLPGLVIHVVPEQTNISPIWNFCIVNEKEGGYKAYVARRENFKDIIVSPYMFLDHLPWRCLYAMQRVAAAPKIQPENREDLFGGDDVV